MQKFCTKKNQSSFYQCDCLAFLKDKIDDTGAVVESREFQRECVASSMCFFNEKSLQERQANIMTMIQYTDGNTQSKKFILPFVDVCTDPVTNTNDDQNGDRPEIAMLCGRKVCRSAIGALLDFSFRKWKTCVDAVKNNRPPMHGNKYNRNAASQFEQHCVTSLHEFFAGLKDFAEPESTCFVREQTGSGLRNGEEDVSLLPSCFSKRSLFIRWCDERGWKMTTLPRGSYKKEKNKNKDGSDVETEPICVFSTFLCFWKVHYPKLRLKSPSEDVCTYCYQFHNKVSIFVMFYEYYIYCLACC
jgi:hypothetical protein